MKYEYICRIILKQVRCPDRNSIIKQDGCHRPYRERCVPFNSLISKPSIMMENNQKHYELVAWTRKMEPRYEQQQNNSSEWEQEYQLRLIHSLHLDAQYEYIMAAMECQKAEQCPENTIRLVAALVKSARYLFLTGEYAGGIRFLLITAEYCLAAEKQYSTNNDHDTGGHVHGEMMQDFIYYYGEALRLAGKYRREDILMEESFRGLREVFMRMTELEREKS